MLIMRICEHCPARKQALQSFFIVISETEQVIIAELVCNNRHYKFWFGDGITRLLRVTPVS